MVFFATLSVRILAAIVEVETNVEEVVGVGMYVMQVKHERSRDISFFEILFLLLRTLHSCFIIL